MMRKKLLLAIAFAIGIWAYVLILAANPKNGGAGAPNAIGAEEGITVLFSPSGGCTAALVGEIDKATQTVDIQAYSFTSQEIAQAVAAANARGVRVRVILDKKRLTERDGKAAYLRSRTVPVFVDDHHTIAHSKVMLIDGKVVVTGSFNFTKEAEEQNAENVLILRDRPKTIGLYQADFEHHLSHSIPFVSSAKQAAGASQ